MDNRMLTEKLAQEIRELKHELAEVRQGRKSRSEGREQQRKSRQASAADSPADMVETPQQATEMTGMLNEEEDIREYRNEGEQKPTKEDEWRTVEDQKEPMSA